MASEACVRETSTMVHRTTHDTQTFFLVNNAHHRQGMIDGEASISQFWLASSASLASSRLIMSVCCGNNRHVKAQNSHKAQARNASSGQQFYHGEWIVADATERRSVTASDSPARYLCIWQLYIHTTARYLCICGLEWQWVCLP